MDDNLETCPCCTGLSGVRYKNGNESRCPLCNGFKRVDQTAIANWRAAVAIANKKSGVDSRS